MYYYSAKTGGFYDSTINGDDIPHDVIEISKHEHARLLSGQSAGKRIVVGDDGRPALADPIPLPASQRRAIAKRTIDTAAGNARARFVSAGQLVEEEYRLALQQTLEWRASGSPSDAVPPAIQDWADSSGMSAEDAAQNIEQTAANWEGVLLQIRKIRLAGKASVDEADDEADFAAIAQPYIDQLDAMQP